MKPRTIKFRLWDKHAKTFGMYSTINNVFPTEDSGYVIQQYTGLDDSKGTNCYEGDIVKFVYFVGDLAWEHMTDKEIKRQNKMMRQTYVGAVAWCDETAGFYIYIGDRSTTHMIFPAIYIKDSEIVGNIFEKPRKNKKQTKMAERKRK